MGVAAPDAYLAAVSIHSAKPVATVVKPIAQPTAITKKALPERGLVVIDQPSGHHPVSGGYYVERCTNGVCSWVWVESPQQPRVTYRTYTYRVQPRQTRTVRRWRTR